DTAKAATEAANAALGAGQARYRELEAAANQAAKAAERAGKRNRGAVPEELAARAAQTAAALDRYGDKLRILEDDAREAATAQTRLSQTLANARKLSGHANAALARQAETLTK